MSGPLDIYRYIPLKRDPSEIRLVTVQPDEDDAPIRITMGTYKLVKVPRFYALSYQWGDPHPYSYTILCGGSTRMISANLHSLLLALRRRSELPHIWIDQLCINQEDSGEISQTISLIPKIYQKSNRTLCWLGSNDALAVQRLVQDMSALVQRYEAAITEILSITDILHSSYKPTVEDLEIFQAATTAINASTWHTLDTFLNNTYFSSLWMTQDVIYSANPVIFTYAFEIPWARLAATLLVCIFLVPDQLIHSSGGLFVLYCETMRHQYKNSQLTVPDILLALRNVQNYSAMETDIINNAYSILNISTVDIDHSRASSDVNDFTSQPLSLSLPERNLHKFGKLPSWSADWSICSGRFLLNHPASTFTASWVTNSWLLSCDQARNIVCTGFVSEIISDLSDYLPSRRACDHYFASGDNSYFFNTWLDFAKDSSPSKRKEEEILLDFANTIQAKGCNHMWEKSEESNEARLQQIKEFLDFLENPDATESRSIQLFYASCLPSHDRRFGITKGKHFCLIPRATKRGDLVCILHGSRVPHVFRPLNGQEGEMSYENIGECYVDGMMFGEMEASVNLLEERVFKLC